MEKMSFAQLEVLYDKMATALDRVAEDRRDVYLARLVIAIAHEVGNADKIMELIDSSATEICNEAEGV
jgi:hypothetical protein